MEKILERWREYMEELSEEEQQAETIIHGDAGPEIALDETRHAVTRLKDNKVTRPDNVQVETFGRHPT